MDDHRTAHAVDDRYTAGVEDIRTSSEHTLQDARANRDATHFEGVIVGVGAEEKAELPKEVAVPIWHKSLRKAQTKVIVHWFGLGTMHTAVRVSY